MANPGGDDLTFPDAIEAIDCRLDAGTAPACNKQSTDEGMSAKRSPSAKEDQTRKRRTAEEQASKFKYRQTSSRLTENAADDENERGEHAVERESRLRSSPSPHSCESMLALNVRTG